MKLPLGSKDAARLSGMTTEELRNSFRSAGPGTSVAGRAFELWAANGQIEPDETGWRVWLMMAGRGFGKTRAGAEWIHHLAMTGRKRIALVAASIDEARASWSRG